MNARTVPAEAELRHAALTLRLAARAVARGEPCPTPETLEQAAENLQRVLSCMEAARRAGWAIDLFFVEEGREI